jgi:tetratricopeptide (TPR) repeat protein
VPDKPIKTTTFRIFISSTFGDLAAERDWLQEKVFPRLREFCKKRACRFQDIDLRWGVSEEAALDQQTMKVCLAEIERCKDASPPPNFLLLLGDRYGWRPLPAEIGAAEFECLLDKAPADSRRFLVWNESGDNAQRGWYRLDRNADPPRYYLWPRSASVPEEANYELWRRTEAGIREILLASVHRMGWTPDDPRRAKYEFSATHQEILAGTANLPPGGGPVLVFFRKIVNRAELRVDCGGRPVAGDLVDTDEHGAFDEAGYLRLERLKEDLRKLPCVAFLEYEARWVNGHLETDLRKLGRSVYRFLARSIRAWTAGFKEAPALAREIAAHRQFAAERSGGFQGREKLLADIEAYIQGDSRHISTGHPLLVCGPVGAGKSAVMARSLQRLKKMLEVAGGQAPKTTVAARFISATPRSRGIDAMLADLCEEIGGALGMGATPASRPFDDPARQGRKERAAPGDAYAVATKLEELCGRFRSLLARVPEDEKLVLFLDGLDELDATGNAHALNWLPGDLKENVRVVVSALGGEDGGACIRAAERKIPTSNIRQVPPLEPAAAARILRAWLSDSNRTLQPHQWDYVLARFTNCPTPLYLRLAFEEARRWRSHDKPEGAPDGTRGLAEDTKGMISAVLARLERPENHGATLVGRTLAYLAASRHGLSEDELLEVISTDEVVLSDFRSRSPRSPKVNCLPVAPWLRLYADLAPYLAARPADGVVLLEFQNSLLRAAATARLERIGPAIVHSRLAGYFEKQPVSMGSAGSAPSLNRRKWAEMAWQLCQSRDWQKLAAMLTRLALAPPRDVMPENAGPIFNGDEFLRYWARIEENSSLRLLDALKPAIESPGDYRDETLATVATALLTRRFAAPAQGVLMHLAERFRRAGRLTELAGILDALVETHYLQHDMLAGLRLLDEEASLWRQLGDRTRLAYCLLNRARLLHSVNEDQEADRIYREQETFFREMKDLAGLNVCLFNRAGLESEHGRPDRAMDLLRECEQIEAAAGTEVSRALTLWQQGSALRRLGLHSIAEKVFAEAERMFRDCGDMEGVSGCLGNRAAIAEDLGRPGDAVPLLREQIQICVETGYDEGHLRAVTNLARLLGIVLGRADEGYPLALEAMVLCDKYKLPSYGSRVLAICREIQKGRFA